MHVDETDDGSVRTLAMVLDETERTGWQGRVTVGHVCALSAADEEYSDGSSTAARATASSSWPTRSRTWCCRAGVTAAWSAAAPPGSAELLAAGVGVAFGQDCVQDGFYPFGRGDMLEVALVSAHAAHLTTAEGQLQALAAVTTVPATAWRLGPAYGVRAGARPTSSSTPPPAGRRSCGCRTHPRQVSFRGGTVARTAVQRELLR